MNEQEIDTPLVAPEKSLAEITIKGIILGGLLSMILAAANAYIGLLVGLVVSASIPASAMSMGILRMFKKSNILENNLVQTSASAGEALVAGIIFTVPRFGDDGCLAGIRLLANGFYGHYWWCAWCCFYYPLKKGLDCRCWIDVSRRCGYI